MALELPQGSNANVVVVEDDVDVDAEAARGEASNNHLTPFSRLCTAGICQRFSAK